MQLQKSLLTATLLAAGSLAAVSANAAGTASGIIDVTLNITSVCTVDTASLSAADINFGTVAAGTAPAQGVSAANVSVQCSTNSPYVINLTPINVPSSTGAGVMNRVGSGTDTVAYQLRQATGTTAAVWGNTGTLVNGTATPGNAVVGTGTGATATATTHTIYATVDATATDVQPGDYKDTVTVAVIY